MKIFGRKATVSFGFLGFLGNLGLFLLLSVLIAAPFVVINLNGIVEKASLSLHPVGAFLGGLFLALFSGVYLAFATVGYSLIHINALFSPSLKLGSLIFSILYIVFATAIIYQLLRMIFRVVDSRKQEKTSRFLQVLFSVFVVLVISCIFYLTSGGETILSGMKQEVVSEEAVPENVTYDYYEPSNDSINMIG